MTQSDHRIGAIVLAAGGSSRLGYPKQLVEYDGVPLVRRAAQAALEAGAAPVVVVVGAGAEQVRSALKGIPGVMTCINIDWETGLASSLKVGLRCIEQHSDIDGVLVTLADQPLIAPGVLAELIAAFDNEHRLVAAAYNGVIGVPALFGKEFFAELAALTGDSGAGRWLRSRADVRTIPAAAGAFDIDTSVDVAATTKEII